MSEMKREPHLVVIDGVECEAFDADHSLADIARWIARNETEAEEMVALLQGILRGPVH